MLNPAQILAETRDTQRFSDLNTLQSAITLYLTVATSPDLGSDTGGVFNCREQTAPGNFGASLAAAPSPFGTTMDFPAILKAAVRSVDGSGWVPVNLADPSLSGPPIASLPLDPTNVIGAGGLPGTGFYYAYTCNQDKKTFELNANLESSKYTGATSANKENSDGGLFATDGAGARSAAFANLVYEVGNDPVLDL